MHDSTRRRFLVQSIAMTAGGIFGAVRLAAAENNQADRIRLLVRADDMGAAHGVNVACVRACTQGIARSVEVIVPGPWFREAAQMLRKQDSIDVGVHLALTSEWDLVKWGPIAKNVPSLSDSRRKFHSSTSRRRGSKAAGFLECGWRLDEVERELRTQIEHAITHLPNVTHLSAHMGTATATPKLVTLTQSLSNEYKLPLKLARLQQPPRPWNAQFSSKEKEAGLLKVLEGLDPGTWMIVTHPGINTAEMRAIGHVGYENVAADRAGVTRALTSERVKRLVEIRNIQLVSYADVLRH